MTPIDKLMRERDARVAAAKESRRKTKVYDMQLNTMMNLITLNAIAMLDHMRDLWECGWTDQSTCHIWYDADCTESQMVKQHLFLDRHIDKIWRQEFRVRMNADNGYAIMRLFDNDVHPLPMKRHTKDYDIRSIVELPDGRWELRFDYYKTEYVKHS